MIENVFVNRTLNMKKIKYIGLDMDHTLIRYHTQNFETLVYQYVIDELITHQGYPEVLRTLVFDMLRAIRGLVVDCKRGNILKLNRYGAIRTSQHGIRHLDMKEQKSIYQSTYVDLNDTNYIAIDTSFSIAFCVLYGQLVDLKDRDVVSMPGFYVMAHDVLNAVDTVHAAGHLKKYISEHLEDFVQPDPNLVLYLHKYREQGKKIFIITNSDYEYTKILLDHAINPYLSAGTSWTSLFEYVITSSNKPRFFYDNLSFLKINPQDHTLSNIRGTIKPGVYQGGNATQFTKNLSLYGDEILYIGDHIYGDILRLKKACNWRTALVVEDLAQELQAQQQTKSIETELASAMQKKKILEKNLLHAASDPEESRNSLIRLDQSIVKLLQEKNAYYNPYWGSVFRAGAEETFFTYQVERYACIYMDRLSDLFAHSPMEYYRAERKRLPHDFVV